jgi:hypothetical protein
MKVEVTLTENQALRIPVEASHLQTTEILRTADGQKFTVQFCGSSGKRYYCTSGDRRGSLTHKEGEWILTLDDE